jgi:hypothetical protein
MFRIVPLSIIRSYSLYTQQWYMCTCHTDSFRAAGSGPNSWSCSKAVYKPVWHISLLSVQWITPDDGQRDCSKHVEFHFQNKLEKLVHLVGFIIRKFVTTLVHMNVRIASVCLQVLQCYCGDVSSILHSDGEQCSVTGIFLNTCNASQSKQETSEESPQRR